MRTMSTTFSYRRVTTWLEPTGCFASPNHHFRHAHPPHAFGLRWQSNSSLPCFEDVRAQCFPMETLPKYASAQPPIVPHVMTPSFRLTPRHPWVEVECVGTPDSTCRSFQTPTSSTIGYPELAHCTQTSELCCI